MHDTNFQNITDNIYDSGRSFLLIIVCSSTTNPVICLPVHNGFSKWCVDGFLHKAMKIIVNGCILMTFNFCLLTSNQQTMATDCNCWLTVAWLNFCFKFMICCHIIPLNIDRWSNHIFIHSVVQGFLQVKWWARQFRQEPVVQSRARVVRGHAPLNLAFGCHWPVQRSVYLGSTQSITGEKHMFIYIAWNYVYPNNNMNTCDEDEQLYIHPCLHFGRTSPHVSMTNRSLLHVVVCHDSIKCHHWWQCKAEYTMA